MAKPPLIIILFRLLLVLPAVVLVSCDDDTTLPDLPTFYLEMGSSYNPLDKATEITMPKSNLTYFVYQEPMIPPWNVTNVEAVRVASGHLALRFYFDSEGNRELYRESVTNMGRMIVTVVDGTAIGARQIDGPLQGGIFYTFTELTEEQMLDLVVKMQESLRKLNRIKNEEGL